MLATVLLGLLLVIAIIALVLLFRRLNKLGAEHGRLRPALPMQAQLL